MRTALHDLELDRILVVHAGDQRFDLAERVSAVPAGEILFEGLR
jgi:hypothetical protein